MYYSLRSISWVRILFILCIMLYFRGMDTIYYLLRSISLGLDTIYTVQYAVFPEREYYLYYSRRSISWRWIIFVLSTTQYILAVNNICTIHYAVYSGVGYCLYY